MELSHETKEFLDSLQRFAGGKLTRLHDLGVLLETARVSQSHGVLDELSFHAKFIHQSHGILRRIGSDAEGYDRLQEVFAVSVQKVRDLFGALIDRAPDDEAHRISADYLEMSGSSLANLMLICADLAWYKNWTIDNPVR